MKPSPQRSNGYRFEVGGFYFDIPSAQMVLDIINGLELANCEWQVLEQRKTQ